MSGSRLHSAFYSLPVLFVNLLSLLHGPALLGLHDQGVFLLEGTFPEKKEQVKLTLIKYLTQHISNVIISTCTHIKMS